jgi:hypothetical protein
MARVDVYFANERRETKWRISLVAHADTGDPDSPVEA